MKEIESHSKNKEIEKRNILQQEIELLRNEEREITQSREELKKDIYLKKEEYNNIVELLNKSREELEKTKEADLSFESLNKLHMVESREHNRKLEKEEEELIKSIEINTQKLNYIKMQNSENAMKSEKIINNIRELEEHLIILSNRKDIINNEYSIKERDFNEIKQEFNNIKRNMEIVNKSMDSVRNEEAILKQNIQNAKVCYVQNEKMLKDKIAQNKEIDLNIMSNEKILVELQHSIEDMIQQEDEIKNSIYSLNSEIGEKENKLKLLQVENDEYNHNRKVVKEELEQIEELKNQIRMEKDEIQRKYNVKYVINIGIQ